MRSVSKQLPHFYNIASVKVYPVFIFVMFVLLGYLLFILITIGSKKPMGRNMYGKLKPCAVSFIMSSIWPRVATDTRLWHWMPGRLVAPQGLPQVLPTTAVFTLPS